MARGNDTKSAPPPSEEPQSERQAHQQMQSEFAKALADLNKGEQTAAALEGGLDRIESKIEELLARAEQSAQRQQFSVNDDNAPPSDTEKLSK